MWTFTRGRPDSITSFFSDAMADESPVYRRDTTDGLDVKTRIHLDQIVLSAIAYLSTARGRALVDSTVVAKP